MNFINIFQKKILKRKSNITTELEIAAPSNGNNTSNISIDNKKASDMDMDIEEYEVVEIEILPEKMICPDCGGITLVGLEFCDKCGGELISNDM